MLTEVDFWHGFEHRGIAVFEFNPLVTYTTHQGEVVTDGSRWNRRHRYNKYTNTIPSKHGGAPALKFGPFYD